MGLTPQREIFPIQTREYRRWNGVALMSEKRISCLLSTALSGWDCCVLTDGRLAGGCTAYTHRRTISAIWNSGRVSVSSERTDARAVRRAGRGGAGRVGTGRRWSITMSTVSPARYHRRCCCCSWASARRTDEPEWLHHCHCTVDCWRSVRMPHPRSAIARWCRNRQPRHAVLRRHCRHSTVDSVITVTCHRWSGAERWATAELRQFSASQRVLVTTGVYHEPFITLTLSERWNRLIIAVGENRANWWVVGNDQKTFRTLITVDGLRSLRLGVASGWVSERLACSQCV